MMIRRTKQRDAIREALEAAGRPLTPLEILEHAQSTVPGLGIATVYRNLKSLLEESEIAPVQVPGEPPRYETQNRAHKHHHHFLCENCGRLFEVQGCPEGLARLTPSGFRLKGHEITLYGVCADCGGRRAAKSR